MKYLVEFISSKKALFTQLKNFCYYLEKRNAKKSYKVRPDDIRHVSKYFPQQ